MVARGRTRRATANAGVASRPRRGKVLIPEEDAEVMKHDNSDIGEPSSEVSLPSQPQASLAGNQIGIPSHAPPSSHGNRPEEDDDSDYEEPQVVIKPRGRKRKNPDGPPPKRPRRDTRKKIEDEGDGSLFDVVKNNRAAIQVVVDDWIVAYKMDRDAALLNLIQFFIQCSGCKGKISSYMYANMEHAEIIRKMTEEFDEDSGDYPLIMSGPQWKKFKVNFCELVQTLVKQCQYSIIYDQYMMDNVISLLTGLTDSQVRAFRHTSTLAAMKLMSALVDVALNLSINLDNTQRQYESERLKQQNKRANERLEMLMNKRQELEENQGEIRNMLTYIFKGVFVHRYRDTQTEIRSICMNEIGVWMKRYPNMFLDDSYLKYVGWTLYDKVGDVRHNCLKALAPLYDSPDLSRKLELFTNRFKDRIVEMTLDKEYEVAVQGVKLVINVLRYGDAVLSDKDCENVYELVYSSNRQVAQAAGEFLNTKLFRKDDEVTLNARTNKGKKNNPNRPLLRDLVQFFIESELHEHGAYLVDSLWDINDMMKDWECFTDLLLESEPEPGEEVLDDRQEASLIELMVCCVKQAATGESPVGRGHANKKLTAKDQKQVLEDKTKLTEHYINTLPALLMKYLMDPEKVANLLQIPQYFDLEIYTSSRQEKNLESLLRYIHEVVEKHTDTEVLENASKVYECLSNDEYAIAGKCDVARKTLIDALVVRFRDAMQEFFAEGEQPEDEETFALLASIKRIYAFYSCHDLTTWDIWEEVFQIVKTAVENASIPDEIVCKAVATCSMAVLWFLKRQDENSPVKEQMRLLKTRLAELMKLCGDLMGHQQDKVNEEAYVSICDLLIVFGRHLGDVAALRPLVYEPKKELTNQLISFLDDKVFVEDDDDDTDENVKIEELHKRRNFLAAFCKLVVYNVISIRSAANMFKHYLKFYNDYGDIIKSTLSKAREISKVATSKTLALSLTQLYHELKTEQGSIDRSSEAFQSIKELARRFALSFGLDQIKNREGVAAIHREGICYSLSSFDNPQQPGAPPENLSFFEILCEFTNKLMKQDKKTVLTYLDKQLGTLNPPRSDDWQPLLTYRNSLIQGEHEINPITLRQASQKRYGRGKGRSDVTVDESVDQTHENYDIQTPAPIMHPTHTSTAIKRRRMDDEDSIARSSEDGSIADFQDVSQQPNQMSWLNSQNRQREMQRRTEANYGRQQQQQPPMMQNLGHHQMDEQSEEGSAIGEFDSSSLPSQSHGYHPQQHGMFDGQSSSQQIDDMSGQPSAHSSHIGHVQPYQMQPQVPGGVVASAKPVLVRLPKLSNVKRG